MQVIALVVATLTLTVIAAIHVAWGMDSTWPFATSAQLARGVVGDRGVMPAPWMSRVVASLMFWGVLLLLAAADVIGAPVSDTLADIGAYGVVAILALRGFGGMASSAYRYSRKNDRTPFVRNDLRFFSPLVAGLALLSYIGSLA